MRCANSTCATKTIVNSSSATSKPSSTRLQCHGNRRTSCCCSSIDSSSSFRFSNLWVNQPTSGALCWFTSCPSASTSAHFGSGRATAQSSTPRTLHPYWEESSSPLRIPMRRRSRRRTSR
uniref:(northern house mosquito) hypothetical protein n=1 Tax=Culex pipiens TaxID=7175 RepID=A0A8D8MZ84_CULPI